MHLLRVWGGKWGQHTVFVLELVTNSNRHKHESLHGELECHFTEWKRTGTGLEAEQYHFDIVGVSSSKCCGFDTVELNEGGKFFYSGVDVIMSFQAGLDIFVSPCLTRVYKAWLGSVTDGIPFGKLFVSLILEYRSGRCAFFWHKKIHKYI